MQRTRQPLNGWEGLLVVCGNRPCLVTFLFLQPVAQMQLYPSPSPVSSAPFFFSAHSSLLASPFFLWTAGLRQHLPSGSRCSASLRSARILQQWGSLQSALRYPDKQNLEQEGRAESSLRTAEGCAQPPWYKPASIYASHPLYSNQ